MSFNSMFGSHIVPGRRWTPKIKVSEGTGMAPPEELRVDPYLPSLGMDPFDPAGAIVIPAGRFVSVGTTQGGAGAVFSRTGAGKTPLTQHDSLVFTPAGFSTNQMYRELGEFMTDSNTVKYEKGFMAEVPFVQGINESYGTLNAGTKVTGYFGSTSSKTVVSFIHRGKPVRWIPKRLYYQSTAAGSSQPLNSAVYPGVNTTVVAALAAQGSAVTNVALPAYSALTWSSTSLTATFGTTGTTVSQLFYEFGHDADQIGGEVVRIQSLTDVLARDNFLRWVEHAPSDFLNFPPAARVFPATPVAAESLTVTNGVARVTNFPMSLFNPVTITITGTVTDLNGTSTAVTGYQLPTGSPIDARGYFNGTYHTVNWRTGQVFFSPNLTISNVTIAYAYVVDPREGAAVWGAGIQGLTDGRYGNATLEGQFAGKPAYGLPSHLNIADVVAAMRLIVY